MPRLLENAGPNFGSNYIYYPFAGNGGQIVQVYGNFGGATVELRYTFDRSFPDEPIIAAAFTTPGITALHRLASAYIRAVVLGGGPTTSITCDLG